MTTPLVQTPVQFYAPLAKHYEKRTKELALQAVEAMRQGDLPAAAEFYQRGVFSQRAFDHYRRIAACIGDIVEEIKPQLSKPETTKE